METWLIAHPTEMERFGAQSKKTMVCSSDHIHALTCKRPVGPGPGGVMRGTEWVPKAKTTAVDVESDRN